MSYSGWTNHGLDSEKTNKTWVKECRQWKAKWTDLGNTEKLETGPNWWFVEHSFVIVCALMVLPAPLPVPGTMEADSLGKPQRGKDR